MGQILSAGKPLTISYTNNMSQLITNQITPANPSLPVNFTGTIPPTFSGVRLAVGVCGSFTANSGVNYFDISAPDARSTSKILISPSNASAATVQRTNPLIPIIKTTGQIRVRTSDSANFAGGEIFEYLILN